jgi:hypothetical protein
MIALRCLDSQLGGVCIRERNSDLGLGIKIVVFDGTLFEELNALRNSSFFFTPYIKNIYTFEDEQRQYA